MLLIVAIIDLNKAIQIDPNNFVYYNDRGFAYQEIGDNARAQADFKRAKELGYNG